MKTINSEGGIRKIYFDLRHERRIILISDMELNDKIDQYFECCMQNVKLIDYIRFNNFSMLKDSLTKKHGQDEKY